jgi:hypothetical protein
MLKVLLSALLACGGVSLAATVSIKVDGVVDAGSTTYTSRAGQGTLDGQGVTLCFTFDPEAALSQSGDGVTHRLESAPSDYMSVTFKLPDGTSLRSPRRGTGNHHTQLYRNYPNPAFTDHVMLLLESSTFTNEGPYRENFRAQWSATKTSPEPDLFPDPNGGLAYDQPMNFVGSVHGGEFNITALNKNSATIFRYFGAFTTTAVATVKRC